MIAVRVEQLPVEGGKESLCLNFGGEMFPVEHSLDILKTQLSLGEGDPAAFALLEKLVSVMCMFPYKPGPDVVVAQVYPGHSSVTFGTYPTQFGHLNPFLNLLFSEVYPMRIDQIMAEVHQERLFIEESASVVILEQAF